MKKFLVALFVMVVTISVGFSYDEVDKTVGGVGAVGPAAMDRSVVISGEYDFADNTYDTNDVIKLLTVPAGVMIDRIIVSGTGLDTTFTNTLYKYTTSWNSSGNVDVFTTNDSSAVHYLALPTITATGPQSTNLTVTVDSDLTADLSQTSWGFIGGSSTNGLPEAGKITISIVGYDVLPSARE